MAQQCHKDMRIMNLSDRVISLLSPSSSLAPFLPPPPFVTVADCVMVKIRWEAPLRAPSSFLYPEHLECIRYFATAHDL